MARAWRRWGAALLLGAAVGLGGAAAGAQGEGARGAKAALEEAARLSERVAALYRAGKYDAAISPAERALAIREKALGPDHPDVADSLTSLAALYEARGDYGRAERRYQRALAVRQKALPPDDPDVANALDNLAWVYEERGEYGRAEPLFERALAILRKALGPDHPVVAASLSSLAGLYESRGEYGRAGPLYESALAILKKTLDPDDPDLARAFANLAKLYRERGEYGRAEPLFERAFAILKKTLGPDHPDVARVLNNLAELYRARREYDRAERLFERARVIRERRLGSAHPLVAVSLTDLGLLYAAQGEYGRAEPRLERALAINEKALGPDHRDVAASLSNLGYLYAARGEYGRAEPRYERALAINEKALGPDHPQVAGVLKNLSTLYWASGRIERAGEALGRADDTQERWLAPLLASGAETQKVATLEMLRGGLSYDVSFALSTRDAGARRLALLALLRFKGRALDAMAGSVRALRARLGPEEQKLFDDLQAARSDYVALTLRGVGGQRPEDYVREREARQDRIRELEDAISRRSEEFRAATKPVSIAVVQAVLPDGAALVEWTVYHRFDPKSHSEQEKFGAPRYAAVVLAGHGDPTWIDLGDAAPIDAAVRALRHALQRAADTGAPALSRALEAKVMAPVLALLGDTRRVFLSPDGALNLVPFAALTGDDGHPLIERYAFTYLTSGRDLLRRAFRAPVRQPPVVVSAPDFDLDQPGGGPFPPLLHGQEVEATLTARFQHPAPVVVPPREATKARLEQVHGPELLHIDSHGYFDPEVCTTAPSAELRDNPLLRSGIALAGANACVRGNHDGLLTASEASGLDLYGTRLVVLSACETGVGKAEAGDGVYGLRRALFLAGAETEVMSLWSVDEKETAALMKAYYEGLSRGGGRSEALRQAQLAMLHDGEHGHPFYWASFIVSGDDRALDGKPVEPDLTVHPGGACACDLERDVSSPAWGPAMAAAPLLAARRRRRSRPASRLPSALR